MSFSDYFNQGRQQEQEHAKKARVRAARVTTRQQKLPFWHPGQILVGAGVMYEIATPIWKVGAGVIDFFYVRLYPTYEVMRTDIQNLAEKIRGYESQELQDYRNFCRMARGKK